MSFTANSKAPQVHPSEAPREPTGPVASDSLAAESLDRGGEFSKNVHAEASSVRGGSSTLNNTDTSAAKVLEPAADGTTRDDGEVENVLSSGGGAGRPAGASDFGASTPLRGSNTGPDPNIKSGGPADETATGTSSTGGGDTTTGVRPRVDVAPGYTSTVTGAAVPSGTYRPKGDNLEDADETQAIPKQHQTFVGDVGGQNDPGRLAERNFVARNTGGVEQNSSSGNPGGAQRQADPGSGGGGGALGEQGGSFGALSGSERA